MGATGTVFAAAARPFRSRGISPLPILASVSILPDVSSVAQEDGPCGAAANLPAWPRFSRG